MSIEQMIEEHTQIKLYVRSLILSEFERLENRIKQLEKQVDTLQQEKQNIKTIE